MNRIYLKVFMERTGRI